MKRREFITLIGGAAAAWPLVARGQQARKLPTATLPGKPAPQKKRPSPARSKITKTLARAG